MPIHLEIVTAEKTALSEDVDQINVPTKDGQIGILPRHCALLTILATGELDIIKDGERTGFAVSGGFMEVLPNRVMILADTIERADEIDEARAERARRMAEERIQQQKDPHKVAELRGDLYRALTRLKVAQSRRIRRKL